MAVDREFMYVGSASPGPGGQTDGRKAGRRADGQTDGWKSERGVLNDSTTIFTDFHKKHQKTIMFSDFSSHAEAQVSIFTA